MSALLGAVGSPGRPAVVILDDCRGTNVLTIAAFRSEEVPRDHVLRSITPLATIGLAPFGSRDMRALVESDAAEWGDRATPCALRVPSWRGPTIGRCRPVEAVVRRLREKVDMPFNRSTIETVRRRRLPPAGRRLTPSPHNPAKRS